MDGGGVLQGVEVPAAGVHGVGDVVDVEAARGEGDDRDQRAPEQLELRAEHRRRRHVLRDLLGAPDDLHARVDVPLLADAHHAGPAPRDEGAGAATRDAGGGVHAAGPVGGDEVLVGAQVLGAVEHGGVALGGEAVLVGVAGDGGDALEAEVEELRLEAGLFEEGHEERAQAAVDVQRQAALQGQLGERRDVVHDAVREVGRGTYEHDGVGVDEAGDAVDVYLVVGCWAWD